MGSILYNGIRFQCYSYDHPPPHVHAFYNGVEVILELLEDGVALASRPDAFTPANANRNYLRHILRVAALHHHALLSLWSEIHG